MKNNLARPLLSENSDIAQKVGEIIQAVRVGGDNVLIDLTEKFDGVKLAELQVSPAEFENINISDESKNAIIFAKNQLEINHATQLPKPQKIQTCEGVICERQARPIDRVGLYIPGGTAPLISTVLMLAVPAQIAGNGLKILCTPPNKQGQTDPHILFAAQLCGIETVYKIGGAQAIAAMAYGTESIPKVDKIFGPGNRWVTQAKQLVSQDSEGAAIDMPAGPSEVMVIADDEANPAFVAADLLSQAEHGVDSQVILIALSEQFIGRVRSALESQLEKLSRKNIIIQALTHSRMIVAENINQAINISNNYAPEHLILQINHPEKYTDKISNAGSVFLGPWAPETIGDYVTGSNHVLPTYGYAKNYSGLSVLDFMKFISFQSVTKSGLVKMGPYAEILSSIEGLDAHKNAVSLRLAELNNG
ncbi:MAG TPA: histidinol dehydrogenase [Gammaproteobacteria bacterium]|nr:histidinol dehydrogenase [Gammaproteobacteria bacterium]